MKNCTFTTKNVPPVERRSRETIMYGFGGLGRALVIVWKSKLGKQKKTNTGGEFALMDSGRSPLRYRAGNMWQCTYVLCVLTNCERVFLK